MILTKLRSLARLAIINIERVVDHAYRRLTGLPSFRRSQLTPDLYLGGQYGPRALKTFREIGITAMVNMRTAPAPAEMQKEFKTLHLPTPDLTAPSLRQLAAGVAFIKKELDRGGKVYIHCRLGEGRGPTMAVAYLMSAGMTLEDAIGLVRSVRQFIKPSGSQFARLEEFETITQNSPESHTRNIK